jgi:ATP-dependent RNA helicase DHX57
MIRAYPLSDESTTDTATGDDDDYGYAAVKSNSIGGYRAGANNKRKDVDYDLLVKLVFYLIKGNAPVADSSKRSHYRAASGCILIFLPGVPEINRFLDFFRQYWKPDTSSPKVNLIALHGNIAPQEQKKVFQVAPRGTIKIVAATNVAEASVTIPDVTVVVDTCRVKEMGYDPETQAYGLTLKFAAKDSLRQRKGRAGRVQEGRCFRLITSGTFEKLPAHSVPEILRLPLESVLLQVWAMKSLHKSNKGGSESLAEVCANLLNRCPDAPNHASISTAQEVLTGLQAIERASCQLTSLGWHLSRLPCTPRVGRLLVYGCLLNCVFPVTCVVGWADG